MGDGFLEIKISYAGWWILWRVDWMEKESVHRRQRGGRQNQCPPLDSCDVGVLCDLGRAWLGTVINAKTTVLIRQPEVRVTKLMETRSCRLAATLISFDGAVAGMFASPRRQRGFPLLTLERAEFVVCGGRYGFEEESVKRLRRNTTSHEKGAPRRCLVLVTELCVSRLLDSPDVAPAVCR